MGFKIRKGIVLLNIHGTYLIAADQSARKYCDHLKELNETGAYLFRKIESGLSVDEMVEMMMNDFNLNNKDELINDIGGFIQLLDRYNYFETTNNEDL